MKTIIILVFAAITVSQIQAQYISTGIGTNNPDSSAVLDLGGSLQGFLPPRLTTVQRLAIANPATGLEVFDLTEKIKMYYDGVNWREMGAPPIGSIQAWHKSLAGTPLLPYGWEECNGQTIADPESPYNGQALPDLNGNTLFLRGSAISGNTQVDELRSHDHSGTTGTDGFHFHPVDPPSTTTSTTGNHTHTGTVNGVNWSDNRWYAVDDNTNSNRTSANIIGDAVQWGTPWNGDLTGGNFISRLGDHTHTMTMNSAGNHSHNVDIAAFNTTVKGDHDHSFTTSTSGGAETRPANMSVVWIIRVK